MDYEKAYNDALERAKKLAHDNAWVTSIFPELKESEDERIRRGLLRFLGDIADKLFALHGISKNDALAYLEKQKEQKPVEWSEEDEEWYMYLLGELNASIKDYCGAAEKDIKEAIRWFKSRYKSLRPQPQREWSEEDEKMNKEIRLYLKQDRAEFPGRAERINKMIEWLINIYPQPQPNMSISFMLYLDEIRPEGNMCLSNGECTDIEDAFNKQDWPRLFKYINKYQPHWKPSEEQMKALKHCVDGWQDSADGRLESLYNDLIMTSKSYSYGRP